jgi:hypothetical protein
MFMTVAKPAPFIDAAALSLLRGRQVYLEFLAPAHREILRPLARDERIWEFTKTLLITETYDQQFDDYLEKLTTKNASYCCYNIFSIRWGLPGWTSR